ncbi:DUF192 domain-containing protein [Arenibaculum pallidiluteum]|uniref:DUF192 domain-containing protein n=1 Tax=Arenibaculum pallidiluteum TaxID=2812559 RepID=UPI001A97241A|nr:DUF192 domain-containing protein [Arenibaculum pallidiluteum]
MINRLLSRLCLALLVAGALLGLPGPAGALETFKVEPLTIETAAGGRYRFNVEMAQTPAQMAQGLMFRKELAPDSGMLFVHPADQIASMWMKNTFIPLDMVFISSDGRVADIRERATPHSLETISSSVPVRAVLELAGGIVSRLGIRRGDKVLHPAFGTVKAP